MTTILSQLSTQKGERSGESNKLVAEQCLLKPELLIEINNGLKEKDRKLVADCAEVMTMVAEKNPEFVAHYVINLTDLISHKDNRARWESSHAMALITQHVPEHIQHIIPEIESTIKNDKSVIVRDYCAQILENYAGISKEKALEIFPKLISILEIWGEKHAKQALSGIHKVYRFAPELAEKIKRIAENYVGAKKKTVQAAAKKLLKEIEKTNRQSTIISSS